MNAGENERTQGNCGCVRGTIITNREDLNQGGNGGDEGKKVARLMDSRARGSTTLVGMEVLGHEYREELTNH